MSFAGAVAQPGLASLHFTSNKATVQSSGERLTPGMVNLRSSQLQGVVIGNGRRGGYGPRGWEQSPNASIVASAASASASQTVTPPRQEDVKEVPATILEAWERFRFAGKDDELPEQYIEREQDRPKLRYDEFREEGTTIPVLDFSLLKSDRAALIKNLADACTEWGFFHLTNHGISREILDELETQAFRFFHLPTERKKASGKSPGGQAYTGDSSHEPRSSLQWAECLRLTGPGTKVIDEWSSRVWPDDDRAFRDVAVKYAAVVDYIFETLLELLAEGLGLETNFFSQHLTEKRTTGLVWNYYPPCPQPEKTLGSRPHTDGCSMTILRTSEIGGLQLQKDGKWVAVKPLSGGLVVNMGDALHAWTNGIYKSVLHRVVANPSYERMSLASFLNVDGDYLISAPDELVDDEHPRLYRPYKFLDYAMHVINTRAKDPYAERDGRVVLDGFRLDKQQE